MRTWKVLAGLLVAVLLAVGGFLGYNRFVAAKPQAATAAATTVEVQQGNLAASISSSGNVSFPTQTSLTFDSASTVTEVNVVPGQSVAKSDILAKIDTKDLERSLASAKASLRTAEINLQKFIAPASQADLARAEAAVASAEASLTNANTALDKAKDPYSESDIAKAEAAVASAEASLASAQTALDKAKIPYGESDIAKAEAAVASAQTSLTSAQTALDKAKNPYSKDDLKNAEAAVAKAQASWEQAKIDLNTTQKDWDAKIAAAQDKLDTSVKAYKDLVQGYFGFTVSDAELYSDASTVLKGERFNADVMYAWQYLHPRPPKIADMILEATNAWKAMMSNKDALELSQGQASKALAAARDVVDKAENSVKASKDTLATMKAGADPEQVALKESQRASAAATLLKAKDDLATAKAGADPEQVALKESQRASAAANLLKAKEDLSKIKAGADPADVAAKEAQVKSAKATLLKAKDDLALLKQGPDPADVETKQIAVDNAKQNVQPLEDLLAKATMRAPFNGLMASVSIKVGDKVGANTVAMVVIDPSVAEVTGTVDEVDVARLRPGQMAAVTLEALSGASVLGTIRSVAPQARIQQGVATYDIVLRLQGRDLSLIKGGMTAQATIVVDSRQNVLLVPNRALRTRGRTTTVEVVTPTGTETKEVTTGLTDGQWTEVVTGLEKGQKVAIQGSTSSVPQAPSFTGLGGLIPGAGFPGGGQFIQRDGGFQGGAGGRGTSGGGGSAGGGRGQ